MLFDAHVLVDYTDTAFAGNGDGHLRLGHRVHGSSDKGDLQVDVAGEFRGKRNFARKHFGVGGNQKDVVEREAVHHNLVSNKIGSHTKSILFLLRAKVRKTSKSEKKSGQILILSALPFAHDSLS